MKIPAYSSLAAFLAHYHALKSAPLRNAEEDQMFAEMTAALGALPPATRAALDSNDISGEAKRHRERAEFELRRELAARGIVAG